MVGGGNAARPTVRIPYAERKLATGRAVLLDCRQEKSIRHALGSRHRRGIPEKQAYLCKNAQND